MDAEFTSFTEEASMPARPPSHIEKTYDRRYIIDVGASGHDYWVKGTDLESIKTNGKKMSKRDGVWTTKDTVVCSVTSQAAEKDTETPPTEMQCRAAIAGKVLQVNNRLQSDPKLLFDRPYDDGYLFMACVFPGERSKIMNDGLSAEAFCKARSVSMDDIRGGYIAQS